ncbi:hypothetical protein [Bacillus sp. EB01]|uniref:hypothetical protein n=1 Tax=Bacillus sp. EB01 TaxID=1347086 RepID=UPI0005C4D827|nr:hypothetical protein [Bacillus sp. EB01]
MLFIILSSTLMIAVCLYLILSPFFTEKNAAPLFSKESFDLESVYEAVNELEMDALMNKISAEDFGSLKDSYYRIAAEAIEQKNKADEDILEALKEIRREARQPEK